MRIFLSAPFTFKINPATKLIEQGYRAWLENIIQELEHRGHLVISAHVREEWGAKTESAEIAVLNDFNSIIGCNLLIAYLDNPPSNGVNIELGFASAFKKPIIFIHKTEFEITYFTEGLGAWTNITKISFHNDSQLFELLDKQLERLSQDSENLSA